MMSVEENNIKEMHNNNNQLFDGTQMALISFKGVLSVY